jgi:hypothetical protein
VGKVQVLEYIAVAIAVFQLVWVALSFFVRAYFTRTRADIDALFEQLREKDRRCSHHGERIAKVEARISGYHRSD